MLNEEVIQENKTRFLGLLDEITIEGANINSLKSFLENSDFFTAPSSTKFHGCYKGGLCEHSLHVYEQLCGLVELYTPGKYFTDSLKIVALLHDISKANFYDSYVQNVKKYHDKGTKSDNLGKFDWFSEERYCVKDVKDRMVGGSHGFNSLMIVNRYIPLTYEESIAILNHMGAWECNDVNKGDLSATYERYSLSALLHAADFLSTYIIERSYE